uniref:Mucin-5AC n=1 Tax=Anopheles dirus TaxID=7168 RepID=A0A182N1L5_9DIPT
MFPLRRGAELFLAIAILALWRSGESLAADSNQRVVCYYTNWSVYRPGTAKFTPQNINPYLCTHLIYSFGGFTKENTLKPYDKYQDIEQGGFAKFTGLKTYNKNLKTLLAIGGWNEGSSRFSPLVADADRRSQFVKNSIKFLRQNHFDGLDLDWEYPVFRDGSKPKDRENYAQLVQELREEFEREASKTGRPRLLLTMAVPAGIEYVEKGYDVPKLNKYLDWFNLLTYDYHSAYEPAVNHHSPLFSLEEASEYNFDSELNIDYSVKFYLKAGADRDKLVLGIPTYGRSYTLYNPDATDIGAPADGPGEQGDATREKGYLAYYEICTSLKESSDWTVVQPNAKAMGPYAYKGNQWVGYDDEAIARRKAKYVAENGLGGIMFWSIDNDDFRGTCHNKPYPIIEAAKEALLASTEVGINDVASSGRPRKPNRSRSRPGSAVRNRVNTDNNNEIKASFKTSQGRKVARPARVTSTTSTTTTTTTEDSLYIGGRTTTPQPPTTPDPGADFKCEDEGFFPHPRDCKKYFWCLDSPSLGLVAHQFTCPSGLVFNKLADSCDYARNVICAKTAPTTTSTTSTTSTTTTVATPTTSTTQRARLTAATSRNTFFNRGTFTTTTTTEPTVEVDYSDEDNTETQPEEDPKVIKELIALIKKVGGIEELEKQLQAQEDGTVALKDAGSDQVSTTAPTISKSLYERVLSRTGTVGQKFRPAITFAQQDKGGSLPENKYSSVVRNAYTNSRVGPQNEGLDQLPEFEGVFREKPKYVTLQRVRPTKATSIEDRYDDDDEIEEEENQPSTFAASKPTSVPKYVSIRRQRPTTTVAEQDEEDEPDRDEDDTGVNRSWYRKTTEATPAGESEPERAAPNRDGPDGSPGDATVEVTTTFNPGESVTGISVSSLDAGLEGSDTFATNDKGFEQQYGGVERTATEEEVIYATTTTTTTSRQRRVGGATPESSEAVDGGTSEPTPAVPVRGNRGRVRFRPGSTAQTVRTTTSTTEQTAVTTTARRRSRPSAGELAANRFAIGRTTAATATTTTTTEGPLTTGRDRGSLRRVNFSLYSGRRGNELGSTSSTEEPRIETEPYESATPASDADIKSYTRIAEDPFMTQERILLTLGTALRYGFSSRNELSSTSVPTTQALPEVSSTLPPERSTFRGRPFNVGTVENVDTMVNNLLAENLNDMSTENGPSGEEGVTPDGRLLSELTTVYNVNAAEVDTTTPQPRKLVSSSLRDRYTTSSTTEAVDATLNVVVSEVNTNKTFIPGRTRPTRPIRLRTTLESGSTPAELETTRSPSRRPFAPRKQLNADTSAFAARFSPTDESLANDVTDRVTGISTTKRQRVNRRRTTTTAPTTAAATDEPAGRTRTPFNTELRRQRLPGNKLFKATPTTTSTEAYTVEPTFPDSNVANSDFTTVITDTSNEIAPAYDLLNSDNLLSLPNLRNSEDGEDADSAEMLSTLAASTTEVNPSANLVAGGQPQQAKPAYTTPRVATAEPTARLNDSQQIESESIPSRSSTRVFGSGATRRKFTGKFVTTEAPEPTEPIKKFVPTRRNRPSFSLARNGRLSTTTEESLVATTPESDAVSPSGPVPFVPSRKRKPLQLGTRTTTTAAPANENVEEGPQSPGRANRRRPAYSLSRPARPPAFENSFDKATVAAKPAEQKSINRTSVLLPKRPNLYARTTTTTTTTTTTVAPTYGDGTDRTSQEEQRYSSSEEQRFSDEESDGENEIQRQGKKLFGALGGDASNSLVPAEAETEKPRPELPYGGIRRPGSRIGPTPPRVQPSSGSNRFIFKNNQPVGDGSATSTTQRAFTTRRRTFGAVGGYKPTAQNGTVLSGDNGGVVAGSVTTPRPRFTPTTRTRATFGRQRSTTASLASAGGVEDERAQVAATVNDLEQGAGFATRRYTPRKPTSRRNFTSPSLPAASLGGFPFATNGTRPGQNVTVPTVLLLTTPEGTPQTTPQASQRETTTSAAVESPTDETRHPHASTTAFTVPSTTTNNNNNNNNNNGTEELTPTTTTTSPWLFETVNEIENTTSYEDTVNTFRTTTEYYTASDETHYTTLNTADTIYTINDNIDIDDVNVLQDRSRTSTTTVKPTTLYHVFSIDKENESVPSSTEIYRTEEQEIELPAANRTDKLVKIHRVVEIYTKNTSNPDEPPVMQKLGEINRKIIIRLVEPNRASNKTGGSSSSVTTTTLGGAPVTERVDDEELDGERGRPVVLSSNSVFTVETSTIPLEGLFDAEKGAGGFPTTVLPPVDTEQEAPTVAPHQEIERISSVDFSAVTEDEPVPVTQLDAETDRYVQVTSVRPELADEPDSEAGDTDRLRHGGYNPPTTGDYSGPAEEPTTVVTVARDAEETTLSTTRTTPAVSSSTQREIVHKYTLPAEFSFQEPASETTPAKTTTPEATTTTTTTTTTLAPELLTTTAADVPDTTVYERVPSLVLPSRESKRKYTKLTGARLSPDFAYSSGETDGERVVVTTEPLTTEPPAPATTTARVANSRHYTNNRKYVSSLSLRPNLGTPEGGATGGGPSYRKSKDIPVVPLPKAIARPAESTTRTTTTTTSTTTTTTTAAPIAKIDFNIKYVLPVNAPDAGSHAELKIESKNDKYSVPLSPILRPDFVTREISGERQDRQFSPVYRPELDNDELTRQLTADADPVALEAANLDREILGSDGGLPVEAPHGADALDQPDSIPPSAAYFLRRTAEVRPQYRPSLRRPSTGGGGGNRQASREQPDTTTERTKSTRRSEVPGASVEQATSAGDQELTTTPTSPLLARRRRPTTASNYLAKLASANRQRPGAVMSSSEESTTTTSSSSTSSKSEVSQSGKGARPNFASGGLRRKYGPANRTGYTGTAAASGGESTTANPGETSPTEVSTRPVNTLFKRRNNGSPLTRSTTPAPPETVPSPAGAASVSAASKFFKKNKHRTGPLAANSVQPTTPGATGDDQNIEPSIRQNSKLYDAKDRHQQIGEPDGDAGPIEQELLDALTTLSRAPLPVVSTTTARNGLDDKEWLGKQPPFTAPVNGRATTHKYNVTHEYPNAIGYSVPVQGKPAHKLRKYRPYPHGGSSMHSTAAGSFSVPSLANAAQRPRIATQSEYYYQQTTPALHYTSPVATATISPRQDTTVLAQFGRNHQYYDKHGTNGRRKQKDDVTGRTYRPAAFDYDYYDDGDTRKVGKSSTQVKVIMHGPGIIECLDQGNFPHPLSCKKFISCAKMEIGGVIGWEYTCPKGLSYDPVGGICNWSAGLGCNE